MGTLKWQTDKRMIKKRPEENRRKIKDQ